MIIPIKANRIFGYATVFHKQAFYVFGGQGGLSDAFDEALARFYGPTLTGTEWIGRLDAITLKWNLAGKLKTKRHGHSVIFDGSQFLVIGGFGFWNNKTENCTPNGTKVTCADQQVGVQRSLYPQLVLVGDDFGNDC